MFTGCIRDSHRFGKDLVAPLICIAFSERLSYIGVSFFIGRRLTPELLVYLWEHDIIDLFEPTHSIPTS